MMKNIVTKIKHNSSSRFFTWQWLSDTIVFPFPLFVINILVKRLDWTLHSIQWCDWISGDALFVIHYTHHTPFFISVIKSKLSNLLCVVKIDFLCVWWEMRMNQKGCDCYEWFWCVVEWDECEDEHVCVVYQTQSHSGFKTTNKCLHSVNIRVWTHQRNVVNLLSTQTKLVFKQSLLFHNSLSNHHCCFNYEWNEAQKRWTWGIDETTTTSIDL